MTFTLTVLRDDVEQQLQDITNARWTVAAIDAAISQAQDRYQRARPQELAATCTVTGRTIDLSAVAPAGLGVAPWAAFWKLGSIRYPATTNPPTYLSFLQWGAIVDLDVGDALVATDVVVRYLALHTLDGAGGTVPDIDRHLLARGAAGYALLQLGAGRVDAINTAGPGVDEAARAHGREWVRLFEASLLRRIVTTGRLYRSEEPFYPSTVVRPPGG